MNFPVPWRCLLPIEAVDYVVYNNSAVLRELSDRTGAMIDVSGERDTPKRLSDRILTMSGQAEQKEGACMGIVERLRRLRDLHDPQEVGFFVIIVPAAAVPVVVGAKGVTIQEVLAASGADLSIGKENIMGMPDTPIGLEGTAKQVVAATAAIHRVVQEMADRGRLMPSDFKYRPEKAAQQLASGAGLGIPQVALPPADHDPYGGLDPTQNFRTKAKLVIDTMTAGWLIGKGGRTIREMQENSGAFLHILREEEAALVLPRPGDRLLEVCGRYERKLEGLQVVMRTADSMPGGQAPKETLMMLPRVLTEPGTLQEVGDMHGCVVEADQSSSAEEVMITIAGAVSNRIQVAQAFLARLDRAHMDGTVVALSVDGQCVGRDGRPRKELRDAGVEYTAPEPPRPAPRPSPSPPPAPPVTRQSEPPPAQRERQPAPLAAARQPMSAPPAPAPAQGPARPPAAELAAGPPPGSAPRAGAALQVPRHLAPPRPQPQQAPPQEASRRPAEAPQLRPPEGPARWEMCPPREEEAEEEAAPAPRPAAHSLQPPAQQLSGHGPSGPLRSEPVANGAPPWEDEGGGPAVASRAGTCAAEELAVVSNLMAGPSLDAGVDAERTLVRSALSPTEPSQLQLLLPEELLFRSLIPGGHLKDVANRCQVTIDLGGEQPCGRRLVTLNGTVAGNAAAAYWLQLGAARAVGAPGS